MVLVVPLPVVVTLAVEPTWYRINVQLPDAGSPVSVTLPVDVLAVGCVTDEMAGGVGIAGRLLITTFADAGEVHPLALVTTNV